MNSIDRLKTAIDSIKSEDKSLTNEEIANRLRYKAKSYVSDILGGSKRISPLFLSRLQDEFSINPEWVESGRGDMRTRRRPEPPPTSDEFQRFVYTNLIELRNDVSFARAELRGLTEFEVLKNIPPGSQDQREEARRELMDVIDKYVRANLAVDRKKGIVFFHSK